MTFLCGKRNSKFLLKRSQLNAQSQLCMVIATCRGDVSSPPFQIAKTQRGQAEIAILEGSNIVEIQNQDLKSLSYIKKLEIPKALRTTMTYCHMVSSSLCVEASNGVADGFSHTFAYGPGEGRKWTKLKDASGSPWKNAHSQREMWSSNHLIFQGLCYFSGGGKGRGKPLEFDVLSTLNLVILEVLCECFFCKLYGGCRLWTPEI